VLRLHVKELNNISRVYDSQRINIYRYTAEVTYALFVDENREIPGGSQLTVEETLDKYKEILDAHAEDRNYRFLRDVWAFLSFEYYVSLGLQKNATQFFDELIANELRVLLRGHRSLTSHILISAFDRIAADATLADRVLQWIPQPDSNHIYSLSNNAMFRAGIAFERGNYAEAATVLNDFLNEVSLKNYFVTEYNFKLFLVITLLCAEKTEQAEIQFRSISRKLASTEHKESLHNGVNEWINLIKAVMSGKSADRKAKITEAVDAANKSRKSGCCLLPHIKLKEPALNALLKLL
jgi:hypothetical protein